MQTTIFDRIHSLQDITSVTIFYRGGQNSDIYMEYGDGVENENQATLISVLGDLSIIIGESICVTDIMSSNYKDEEFMELQRAALLE